METRCNQALLDVIKAEQGTTLEPVNSLNQLETLIQSKNETHLGIIVERKDIFDYVLAWHCIPSYTNSFQQALECAATVSEVNLANEAPLGEPISMNDLMPVRGLSHGYNIDEQQIIEGKVYVVQSNIAKQKKLLN